MIYINLLCQNELPYIKNLVPQLTDMCDEIYMCDGGSTDGTVEWLEEHAEEYKIKLFHRKWDWHFGKQRDFLLQKTPKDSFVIRIDADEIPTNIFRVSIKSILNELIEDGYPKVDRLSVLIYHITNQFDRCSGEAGKEMRIFWHDKDTNCSWQDKTHEIIHGTFKTQYASMKDVFGFIHLKYIDMKKIQRSRDEYVPHGLIHRDHLDRMQHPKDVVQLPNGVDYIISRELKKHIVGIDNDVTAGAIHATEKTIIPHP